MLERALFDTLPLWPLVFYTIIADSILLALYRFNHSLKYRDDYHGDIYSNGRSYWFFCILYLLMTAYAMGIFIYLVYCVGWLYLIVIPVLGILTLPVNPTLKLIDLTRFAQYIYPGVYMIINLALAVYIGFFKIPLIVGFNEWLTNILTSLV